MLKRIYFSLAIIFTVASIFLFNSFYKETKNSAIAHQIEEQAIFAKQAVQGIEDFFVTWTQSLSALSKMDAIINNNADGNRYLINFYEANHDHIKSITRLDKTGKIFFNFPSLSAAGIDVSGQKHVRELLRGHKPVVSDVFRAVEGFDAVAIHVPIFKNGVFEGSIGVLIDFESIAKRYLGSIKIGETGYAWVISRDGTLLYSPVPGFTGKLLIENIKYFPELIAIVNDMLEGHEGTAAYTFDKIRDQNVGQIRKNAVYRPVKIGNTFWSIAVVSTEQEVLSGLSSFRNKLTFVIGAIFIFGMVFSSLGVKAWLIAKEFEKCKKIEKSLLESEMRLNMAVDSANAGLWNIDMSNGQIWATDQALTMYGIVPGEVVDMERFLSVVHEEDRNQVVQVIDDAVLDRKPFVTEYRIILPDGSIRWIAARGSYNPSIEVMQGLAGASIDITERKLTELTLLESKLHLMSILQSTADGILAVDNKGKILYANQRFNELWKIPSTLTGCDNDQQLLNYVLDQLKDPDFFVKKVQSLYGSEDEDSDVLEFKDGRVWERYSTPMLSGEIIAGRVWSFRDCTDQKRSEQLMLKEKEFSRTLLESLPGIYYLYTLPELRLVRWNNNHETMTGYSHEELYHKHALSWFEPAEQAFIAKGIEIALEKGSHITETKLIKKDGQLLPLLITGSIFQDSDQTYMMGFGIDITERIRVETELLHYQNHLEDLVKDRTIELKLAQDEAIAANKAKSTFFSNMSHEIRTPLNAVLGFSQLLEREPSLTPQGRSRLQTIMKSGEYLLSIINDVLAMSRIEAGQVELRATSIDLNDLLHDLAIMFRQRADEKGISFVTNCSEQLPHFVMADIGKLRQVLINLIGNAIKFTLQGSITLRVYPCEDNYIVIEVEDTGIGISPEEQENLFRPFVRSSRGGEIASGTGLGLAISREYATIMGGTITVSSTIDIGSCFRFEFHAPAVSASELTAAVKRRVVGLAPGQGDIHILVVDDHRDNRDLLRGFLEQLDFIVDDAAGGVEAIEKMRTRLSHIILMDLVMPGMDGAETTRLLRASYPDESLTIIGISASVFEREKINFLDSGIDAFIAKPVRQNELFDILEQHAGIVFVEEAEDSSITLGVEQPTLEKMSAEWLKTFKLALSRGNITQIRKLGQEVLDKDPVLSAYLLSRADVYDLDGLKKLISLSKPA